MKKITRFNLKRMNDYTKIYLFCILFLCGYVNSESAIIQARVLTNNFNVPYYVATVRIGSPEKDYFMQVSWQLDNIYFYDESRQDAIISSYENNGIQYDIVFLGANYYRIPITYDSEKRYESWNMVCQECQGIIGFGPGSYFWRLFNGKITFTKYYIELGDMTHQDKLKEKNRIMCDDNINNFCASSVYYENSPKSYTLLFNSQIYNTYLPNNIYRSYIEGKNIYETALTEWNDIKLHIPVSSGNEDSFVKFEMSPYSMVSQQQYHSKKKLLIDSVDNQSYYDGNVSDCIIMGMNLLQDQIIHKNQLENYVVMYSIDTAHHYSFLNLLLFVTALLFLLGWKLTPASTRIISNNRYISYYGITSISFEYIGMLLVIACYILPSSIRKLSNFTEVYIVTTIEIGVIVVTEIFINMYIIKLFDKKSLMIERSDSSYVSREIICYYQATIIRNMCHDTKLLIAMWIVLLERTQNDLSIVPTMFINIYIFYNLSYYLFCTILTLMEFPTIKREAMKKNKSTSGSIKLIQMNFNNSSFIIVLLFYFTVLFIFMYVWQIYFTYRYFLVPWFKENAPFLDDVKDELSVILLFIALTASCSKLMTYVSTVCISDYKKIAKQQ